jgi:prepilin-type N-terminal cleavage/methylation domain-containing protein
MRPSDQHGFTLIELLVTMVITVIVFGATLSLFEVFQSNNNLDQLRNETQDNARNMMDGVARQLRNVIAPTKGNQIEPGALEQAEPYSIMFETVDTSSAEFNENASHAMRVRYCLNNANPSNEVVWQQTERWESKEAPEPAPTTSKCPETLVAAKGNGWQTQTKLVEHATNKIGGQGKSSKCAKETIPRCLFLYSATGVPQIVSVESTVFLNVSPTTRRPGETMLTSGVSLRNANRPPLVSFTITPLNTQVELNASSSHDPDGLALSYKWWEDGVLQSTTSQRWITTGSALHGTHKFKLQVTNPGGLSSEEEKPVTLA